MHDRALSSSNQVVDVTATGSEQVVIFTELSSQTNYIVNCIQSVGSPASTLANNALSHQSLGDVVEGSTTALECANGKISNDQATCACDVGYTGGGFFLVSHDSKITKKLCRKRC